MPRTPTPLPCRGLRAADTVQPLDFCQTCRRWQIADQHGQNVLVIGITLCDLVLIDGRLGCAERLPAEG